MYTMLIGSLSLAGFPYFTGFFTKDEIIVTAYEYGVMINYLPYIFLVLAAVLTAIYTFRMWFSVFTGKARSDYGKHESPWVMLGPLVVLAVFASGFGYVAQGGFYSYLDSNFEHYDLNFNELAAIGGHATEETILAGEPTTEPYVSEFEEGAEAESKAEPTEPWPIQILPIIVALGGILTAALFYWDKVKRFDPSQVTGDKGPIAQIAAQRVLRARRTYTAWFSRRWFTARL